MSHPTLSDAEIEFIQHSNYIEHEASEQAFADAADAWLYLKDLTIITKAHILTAHAMLMRTRTTIPPMAKGHWTTVQTMVGNRMNPNPKKVPKLVERWIADVNKSPLDAATMTDADKDILTQRFHVRFEQIHPFRDGNGRIGRILYQWHRLRVGLPIHVIREEDKHDYYLWFRE